jgi:glyoxylase-like metal-dependent hydrolase (beta-lactamase superfamily II)
MDALGNIIYVSLLKKRGIVMSSDMDMAYGGDYKFIPVTSIASGKGIEVLPDLFCYTVQIVNILFAGDPATKEFVLVDAGMPHSAKEIISAAEKRFGSNCRPQAIILTHGHFDHVGAIVELVKHWQIPVYAHELELPFLRGELRYPEPDPTVEGGLVAKFSSFFPNEPIQLGSHVKSLSPDGSLPFMPGYQWIHTPGHAPGHVSLFREKDRTLIAGDAFVTVKQDSLYNVITQKQEIYGPPRYFTTDWMAAKESVQKLQALHPAVAVTGHGMPMSGELLSTSLGQLVRDFDRIAIPDYGRYVQ